MVLDVRKSLERIKSKKMHIGQLVSVLHAMSKAEGFSAPESELEVIAFNAIDFFEFKSLAYDAALRNAIIRAPIEYFEHAAESPTIEDVFG